MKKKGHILKWIFGIYIVFFVLQIIIPFAIQFYNDFQSEDAVSDYGEVEVAQVSWVELGESYHDYTARDGYTLYAVSLPMTNRSAAQYVVTDSFSYRADGSFSNGFKGGTYSETTNTYEMEACDIIYSNCQGYHEEFGYDTATVIPGGCTITHTDIIEIPVQASHINLYCTYTGNYLIDL